MPTQIDSLRDEVDNATRRKIPMFTAAEVQIALDELEGVSTAARALLRIMLDHGPLTAYEPEIVTAAADLVAALGAAPACICEPPLITSSRAPASDPDCPAHRNHTLEALLDIAEAARRVDQEWIERGDGGCSANLRLDLHVALGNSTSNTQVNE